MSNELKECRSALSRCIAFLCSRDIGLEATMSEEQIGADCVYSKVHHSD